MSIPGLDEPNILIVLPSFPDDQSDLAAQRIIGLLLSYLAFEEKLHAFMILFDQ